MRRPRPAAHRRAGPAGRGGASRPRSPHGHAVKRILVGLDGSAASLDALRWTVALADAAAADFTAVYAFTPSYAEVSLDQYEVLRAQAEQRLIGWSADSASRSTVARPGREAPRT